MKTRRLLIATGAAWLAAPTLAGTRRALAPMTEGPFYPAAAWRARWNDWDADLTRVAGAAAPARGEHLALQLAVTDTEGRAVDNAEVEIWQCDAMAQYRHPRVAQEAGRFDAGFQGFGGAKSARDGGVAFRTIRPVPYPGRTPHIHVRVRHPSFGDQVSQLFLAGDPGNARDFLWRSLGPEDQQALAMKLEPAPRDSGLAWQVQHALVLGKV